MSTRILVFKGFIAIRIIKWILSANPLWKENIQKWSPTNFEWKWKLYPNELIESELHWENNMITLDFHEWSVDYTSDRTISLLKMYAQIFSFLTLCLLIADSDIRRNIVREVSISIL